MSFLMRKLLSRVYREEENGSGSSEGSAAPAPAAGKPAVDWADLNEGISAGSDDDEYEEEESSSAPVSDPATPEGKTGETPTTDEDASTSPPEAETAPAEDEVKPLTPEEQAAQVEKLQKDFDEWRQAEVAKLEKAYTFDEETASRLLTEPELVLPKLAAELELNATRRALEAVQRMIPQLVPQVVQTQATEKEAEKFFYGKNPDLRKHHKHVLKAGALFRQMNPNATPEEAAEGIGNIVRQTLKLPAQKQEQQREQQRQQSTKQTPHRPAGAGSAPGAAPTGKAEKSVWAELAEDDDD